MDGNIQNMNDEDFMNIVEEEFAGPNFEAILDEETDDDEDHQLSEDSDYNSDDSNDYAYTTKKVVPQSQLNALSNTKLCAVYYYYKMGDSYIACTSCMIEIAGVNDETVYTVHKHLTDFHAAINGKYCSNCGKSLFMIYPCNTCPECK